MSDVRYLINGDGVILKYTRKNVGESLNTFPLYLHPDLKNGMPRWRTCLPAGRIGRRKVLLFLKHMFFVYAIKSLSRNYIYVGLTNDVEKRLKQHNNGETEVQKHTALFHCCIQK
jgi:hypothetical protein